MRVYKNLRDAVPVSLSVNIASPQVFAHLRSIILMPGITLRVPAGGLPDTPPPKNSAPFVDIKPAHSQTPSKSHMEVNFVFSLPRNVSSPLGSDSQPLSHGQTNPSSTINPSTAKEEIENETEEHTLSAYGDLSLSEDVLVQSSTIQKKTSRPRLRLKVRRPPMPKRRMSYVHAGGGTTPASGEVADAPWPGSPSPLSPHTPLHQHQPLLSPLSADPSSTSKSSSSSDLSIGKLVDGLMPQSPSIFLSVVKSCGKQAVEDSTPSRSSSGHKAAEPFTHHLKQGTKDSPLSRPKPLSSHLPVEQPKPAPQQSERKSGGGGGGGWRTRLPPRPPIPKWDL